MKVKSYAVKVKIKGVKKFGKKCNRVVGYLDKVTAALDRNTEAITKNKAAQGDHTWTYERKC